MQSRPIFAAKIDTDHLEAPGAETSNDSEQLLHFLTIKMKKNLLAIASLGCSSLAYAQCTELFFSEYVEGTSHSKALEIYNPTPNPVALNNYRLIRFSNGSATPVDSVDLTGTCAAHDVWVVVNGQATPDGQGAFCDPVLMAMGDQVAPAPYVTGTAVLYMNGDDAIVLCKISPRTFVDIFGKIGQQPATAWSDQFPYDGTVGTWWTKDHTLIRKSSVTAGVTANPTYFNVTTEWDSLPVNTWTDLGLHNSTCNTSAVPENFIPSGNIIAYPNPSNGIFTLISILAMERVEIVNVLGETVFVSVYGKDAAVEHIIDLSGLASGIYTVKADLMDGNSASVRITVQ